MQYSTGVFFVALTITNVLAHGVVTEIQGANGVNMPGLSVVDGTPRDCATLACGAEADTSIIRARELGTRKARALGRTATGPVSAAKMIAIFMDGTAENAAAVKRAPEEHLAKRAAGGTTGKTAKGTVETGVKASTGIGTAKGLPTCSDDGVVSMTFHQVNQDGAGPLIATIDPTSGGTDPAAFESAAVIQNVPGLGFGGLSAVTTTDFPVTIQMPAGMTCSGTSGGATNVCVARLRNSALAGPFGGSVAFTQSPAARKRAIEYNLARRRFARAL